jgi:hypothetical protein
LVNERINVIDENDNDIYYYLNEAEYQIGVYSTVIFEGLGFGLKTFIVNLNLYETMEELYNNDYAMLVSSAKEIFDNLDSDLLKNIEDKISYFWESNSKNKTLNAINRIIYERK